MAMAAQYDFVTNTQMLDRGIYTSVSQPPSINLFQYWALEVEYVIMEVTSVTQGFTTPKTKRVFLEVMN